MPGTGTVNVDFGAFPGASHASQADTATGIAESSLMEAWILPGTTADHSADEHMVETIKVTAVAVADNITIHAFNTSQLGEPGTGGRGTRLYGAWHVGYAWF